MLIEKKLSQLKRRYRFINDKRFIYKQKTDLLKRDKTIKIWCLCFDEDQGHAIFLFRLTNAERRNVKQWTEFLLSRTAPIGNERTYRRRQKHLSGIEIIREKFLEYINVKPPISEWRLVDVIGWTFLKL